MRTSLRPVAVFVIASALITGCADKIEPGRTVSDPGPALTVPIVSVERTPRPMIHEAVGTVRARVSATVASKLMGVIRGFAVQEGDRVKKGDLLVELDDRQVVAQLDQARAALAEAKKAQAAAVSARDVADAGARQTELAYQRNKALLSGGAVTRATFETVEATYRQAQASQARAEAMVAAARSRVSQSLAAVDAAAAARADARLVAPYDGQVSAKLADEGDLAAPGTPLLRLERQGGYRVDLAVPETYIQHLHTGQALEVRIPAIGAVLSGTVAVIEPAADRATRTTVVQVRLPTAPALRSGLFARAALPVGEADAILIPWSAVVRNGQLTGVFIVDDDNRARFRLVRLGRTHGSAVAVISGVPQGTRLVSAPSAELHNGVHVEPAS